MTKPGSAPRIGVLALQGAFREHRRAFEALGAAVTEVRLPRDLDGLSGLAIPGGESTTIGKLMEDAGLRAPLLDFAARGGALWGTCAGLILLSDEIVNPPPQFGAQPTLGLLRARVRRNAFGRQVASFEEPLAVAGLDAPFPAVYIRAPAIEAVGEGVEVLARRAGGEIVHVRSNRVLASAFHPELTADRRLHALFLKLAEAAPIPVS